MKKAKTFLAAATLAGVLIHPCAFADDPSVSKLENATTEQITWGKHWAGPELKGAKSLEGKVVLLKIWGG